MKFNSTKFEVVKFGPSKSLKTNYLYLTPGADDIIHEVETVKDLGVFIDNDLKFTSHINKLLTKVKQKVGWVMRNFKSKNHFILKTLWRSLIQPHLDYCSPLWFNPNNLTQVREIENIQRQLTKRFEGIGNLNYWDRLKHLKMLSQERCLERYRIIYTWKALENLIPDCGISYHYSPRRAQLVNIQPVINTCSSRTKTLRDGSFQVNGPRLFNSLPLGLHNMTNCSAEAFKNHLDQFLSIVPDEPSCDVLRPSAISHVTGRFSNSIIDQVKYHSLA